MKLSLLGNVIQTVNIYLLLQEEGSSGQLKHSWDGSAAHTTVRSSAPRRPAGMARCRGRGSTAKMENSTAATSAAEARSCMETWPLQHGPRFTHTDEAPSLSSPVLPSVLPPASKCPWKGPMGVHPNIWSGAHPSLRPASLGTVPALIRYLSDLK